MAEIQPNWTSYYRAATNLNLQGNPALDLLRQDYQRRETQRLNDSKEFTNELAKLSFNGARDADLPVLHDDYGKILNAFQQYRSENDPKKQAALNLQMRQLQNQFLYKAQLSREENNQFHEDAKLAHNPNVDLDDSYWTDMKKRANTSSFDPKYEDFKNKQYLVPKSDPVKDAQEIAKGLMSNTTSESNRYNKATGSLERVSTTSQDLDHDKFLNAWVQTHINDPNKVKTAIRQTGEQDPAKAVAALGEAMYDAVSGRKNAQKVTGGGLTMASREELQQNAARLKSLYPTFQQGQNLTPIYRQKWVGDMLKGIPESGEALKAKIAADPRYDAPLGINVKGDDIIFTIPNKRKFDVKNNEYVIDEPYRRVTINKKDPNAEIKLNELTNQLTGEKVDISSFKTPGGKKHIGTGATTQSYQHQQTAKDSKGNVVTLGYKNGKWYNVKTNKPIE
jgi:hypothetical protein